jgi:hypothetical protein
MTSQPIRDMAVGAGFSSADVGAASASLSAGAVSSSYVFSTGGAVTTAAAAIAHVGPFGDSGGDYRQRSAAPDFDFKAYLLSLGIGAPVQPQLLSPNLEGGVDDDDGDDDSSNTGSTLPSVKLSEAEESEIDLVNISSKSAMDEVDNKDDDVEGEEEVRQQSQANECFKVAFKLLTSELTRAQQVQMVV